MNREDATQLTGSKSVLVATSLEMCFNIINFMLVPYLYIRMETTKMMHQNLKKMLLSLTISLGIFNFARLWESAMFYLLMAYDFVQRHNVFYNNQCWFSRLLEDTTMNLFGITMAAMAIERMIATIAARNYEKSESDAVSTLLISLQWSISAVVAIYFIAKDWYQFSKERGDSVYPTCSMIFRHSGFKLILFIAGMFGFFFCAVLLIMLYRYNHDQYSRKGNESLTTRYQFAENITTLRLLIPVVFFYGAFYFGSCCMVAFMHRSIGDHGEDLQTYKKYHFSEELVNIPTSIYSTVHCFLCILLYIPLRNKFKEDARKMLRVKAKDEPKKPLVGFAGHQLTFPNEGEVYFEKLRENWL